VSARLCGVLAKLQTRQLCFSRSTRRHLCHRSTEEKKDCYSRPKIPLEGLPSIIGHSGLMLQERNSHTKMHKSNVLLGTRFRITGRSLTALFQVSIKDNQRSSSLPLDDTFASLLRLPPTLGGFSWTTTPDIAMCKRDFWYYARAQRLWLAGTLGHVYAGLLFVQRRVVPSLQTSSPGVLAGQPRLGRQERDS
jgi:hypothetical protein